MQSIVSDKKAIWKGQIKENAKKDRRYAYYREEACELMSMAAPYCTRLDCDVVREGLPEFRLKCDEVSGWAHVKRINKSCKVQDASQRDHYPNFGEQQANQDCWKENLAEQIERLEQIMRWGIDHSAEARSEVKERARELERQRVAKAKA